MKANIRFPDLQLFAEDGAAAGVSEADAGPEVTRNEQFEQLIGGEYKDLYDERVQSIVRSRVKNYRERAEHWDRMEPLARKLAQKYGTEDPEALIQALEEPRKRQPSPEDARRLQQQWEAQAEAARGMYPELDLARELKGERFRSLLLGGVDVRTAYESAHRDRILPALMHQAEQRIADSVAANGRRPPEGSTMAAAAVKSSVASLSRKDMAEIERRVRSGERISFG